MALLNRGPKVDPNAMFVCLDSFSGPHGAFQTDQRVSGSHPAVAHARQFFIEDGADSETIAMARNRLRFGAFERATAGPAAPNVSSNGTPMRLAKPLETSELVVATEAVGPYGGSNHPTAPIAQGQVVPKTHPAVLARPHAFRPATEEDPAH